MEPKDVYKTLLDSSFPLLEKFRESIPGTYRHCMNVADFCESIAKDLKDIDPAVMRCAALYHDIGKINNPSFFSENQNGENPHDKLDPYTSYHIITRHVADGVIILVEYDFPIEVIKIISQHHGNTVLRYFCDKAQVSDELKDEYRYPYTPPKTTESAVLLVSDSIEARARALFNAGKLVNKNSMISDTIEKLTEDGQLNDLKIGVLNKMKIILLRELENTYHKREVYEDDVEKGEEKDE